MKHALSHGLQRRETVGSALLSFLMIILNIGNSDIRISVVSYCLPIQRQHDIVNLSQALLVLGPECKFLRALPEKRLSRDLCSSL